MSENNIKGILETTMEKLRGMIDAEVITGTPTVVGDITLIPVSRVSYGLATGGSDFPGEAVRKTAVGEGLDRWRSVESDMSALLARIYTE